jgi:hypothetical protein
MCVVALSFFGLVAYLQFISARVDPSRMGALQGALGACVLFGYILGNTLFTILSIRLGEFDHLVFGIGACIMACGSMLVAYLQCTFSAE